MQDWPLTIRQNKDMHKVKVTWPDKRITIKSQNKKICGKGQRQRLEQNDMYAKPISKKRINKSTQKIDTRKRLE